MTIWEIPPTIVSGDLSSLKHSKSPAHHGIHPCFLRMIVPIISHLLATLYPSICWWLQEYLKESFLILRGFVVSIEFFPVRETTEQRGLNSFINYVAYWSNYYVWAAITCLCLYNVYIFKACNLHFVKKRFPFLSQKQESAPPFGNMPLPSEWWIPSEAVIATFIDCFMSRLEKSWSDFL